MTTGAQMSFLKFQLKSLLNKQNTILFFDAHLWFWFCIKLIRMHFTFGKKNEENFLFFQILNLVSNHLMQYKNQKEQ